MTLSHLYPGDQICGKWNQNTYKILAILGVGGIGKVYKVVDIKTHEIWALKISSDIHSVTKEYEMLKKFESIQCIPRVKEIDDFFQGKQTQYYIVLEYIQGKDLKNYLQDKSISIKTALGITIIVGEGFQILHKNKLVFGDLKLENLMIDEKNQSLKVIDLGGVTPMGCSIKEFTPLYDRASWNMGLRRADEKYDLFSISMLLAILLLKRNHTMQVSCVDHVIRRLKNVDIPSRLVRLIHKGLKQKSISFEEFLLQIKKIYQNSMYHFHILDINKYNKKNMLINGVFIGSVALFIGIVAVCFRKSIWF
ncbi:protein kinase [Clostridiaceae bacterium 35-E11]